MSLSRCFALRRLRRQLPRGAPSGSASVTGAERDLDAALERDLRDLAAAGSEVRANLPLSWSEHGSFEALVQRGHRLRRAWQLGPAAVEVEKAWRLEVRLRQAVETRATFRVVEESYRELLQGVPEPLLMLPAVQAAKMLLEGAREKFRRGQAEAAQGTLELTRSMILRWKDCNPTVQEGLCQRLERFKSRVSDLETLQALGAIKSLIEGGRLGLASDLLTDLEMMAPKAKDGRRKARRRRRRKLQVAVGAEAEKLEGALNYWLQRKR